MKEAAYIDSRHGRSAGFGTTFIASNDLKCFIKAASEDERVKQEPNSSHFRRRETLSEVQELINNGRITRAHQSRLTGNTQQISGDESRRHPPNKTRHQLTFRATNAALWDWSNAWNREHSIHYIQYTTQCTRQCSSALMTSSLMRTQ